MIDHESFEDEAPSLMAQARAERRYQARYRACPDPRDPDFPGYPGEDSEADDE